MQADAANIWRIPVYLPYLQPTLTDKTVADAEAELGVQLPKEYLELLRAQNGGYICFELPDMAHTVIAGIGEYFPSILHVDWDECREFVSFELDGLIPIDGDGHWHICLDYRNSRSEPRITYADVECDIEKVVASSFSEYLRMLHRVIPDSLVVESVTDINLLRRAISKALNVQFDQPDSSAHGYPVHRANLGRAGNPEWLFLSPNDVPRSFARPHERNFTERHRLLPGNAAHYAELPADSYLLRVPDRAREGLLKSLEQSDWLAGPLKDYVSNQ
ncbi:SMI1/KNR4 family protein [Stratiformator vulcanicus]|uniref:SMI1 / KNR4 family protein n=1 Tax=Stratiformator vulcanicus TaxID=2527980 RepID=A0A517QX77_9PLAN|nr:SMI1/KNR4 family protein [Stratiformator vulcanicus]QDT36266.1 SMI1 / KNR4 family protein [Stratiformator vulcanicus]